jgi:uncharacterized protein (TIGR02594 family)
MISYERIQKALIDAGYSVGRAGADGIWGRDSIAACKRFQKAKGLDPIDGIPGIDTLTALGFYDSKTTPKVGDVPLPWYDAAENLLGLKEGPGARDNPTILDWADDLDIAYEQDSIPWCGLFVAHCVGSSLPEEPLPANPLGARNWMKAGVNCNPQLGAILVFWRVKKSGWQGHVGFYSGERSDAYKVLGGNQSDSVSHAWIAKNRLLGARWPTTAPFLATGSVQATGGGNLSTNEA